MAKIELNENDIEKKFNEQCRTCLSVGRKMLPLGEFENIYRNLTSDYELIVPLSSELLRLCWECHALLSNIQKFQCQVKKANEMLSLGQNFLFSLSRLSTVIQNKNEPNIVYVYNQVPEKEILNAGKCINPFSKDLPMDNIDESDCYFMDCNNIDEKEKIKDSSFKNIMKVGIGKESNEDRTKVKKVNNKWAQKRAIQNKKAKFKEINCKELHIDKIFFKLQLDEGELKRYMQNKSDSKIKQGILIKHIKSPHDVTVKSYICDICSKSKSDKNKLSNHIQNHYNMYKCRVCNYICNTKKNRWRHVASAHKRILQCLKCDLLFGSRREFFEHFKQWHEKFICDQCGISFKMRYCIKDHIRKQHSPFECKPCAKRFARYNGLWLHNKIQHGGPTTPAYCVECDRRYPDYYRYRWHLANSARHKPRQKVRIPCPECDKVFSKNIYMKDHYNLVHLKNYKYRCEECNKNFIRNADLTKHNRRVHEGIMPPRNKICYMCGRGFTTNKILANHLRTHTGERPYACTHCEARFAQAAALSSHVRSLHSR
ncbi:unnamed protein product [Parnassius mnemosyne]